MEDSKMELKILAKSWDTVVGVWLLGLFSFAFHPSINRQPEAPALLAGLYAFEFAKFAKPMCGAVELFPIHRQIGPGEQPAGFGQLPDSTEYLAVFSWEFHVYSEKWRNRIVSRSF